MKAPKIKRYRLAVSRTFPKTHPKSGEPTYFVDKIKLAMLKNCTDKEKIKLCPKIHTIRANYPLWEKRMKEVQEGLAVIELFYWSDKPYNSPQVVFATLDKDSECGVQALYFKQNKFMGEIAISPDRNIWHSYTVTDLAKNDSLSFQDFTNWFEGYDLSEPLAIIHFTNFRY